MPEPQRAVDAHGVNVPIGETVDVASGDVRRRDDAFAAMVQTAATAWLASPAIGAPLSPDLMAYVRDGMHRALTAAGVPALLAEQDQLRTLIAELEGEAEMPDGKFPADAIDLNEVVVDLRERLVAAETASARADEILAGREIDPTAGNAMVARRFRRLCETRTAELAAALARIDELEAENTAVDEGRPEALDRLLAAITETLPAVAILDRLAAAERAYRQTHRVAVRATSRLEELLGRAERAEVRVARIREVLDGLEFDAEAEEDAPRASGMRRAADRIREALDGTSGDQAP
ncbi:hypothetical protein [Frankia sp. Cj3]|uniref:hypothetical protein n=1 Tax=Frankia sp. Cj3 TaxID=2880976 RepID=UPI001EF4EA7D|nr:hypothetical protein [Frankia sp. Cj3]